MVQGCGGYNMVSILPIGYNIIVVVYGYDTIYYR